MLQVASKGCPWWQKSHQGGHEVLLKEYAARLFRAHHANAKELIEESPWLRKQEPLDLFGARESGQLGCFGNRIVEGSQSIDETNLMGHPAGEHPPLGERLQMFLVKLPPLGDLAGEEPIDVLHGRQEGLTLMLFEGLLC